jgi:TPR repeat protein
MAKLSSLLLGGVPLCAGLLIIAGAARAGNMEDAMRLYEKGSYVLAVDRFNAAAVAGNARAQEILGVMYALGGEVYPGVPKDAHKALYWFDMAARNGRGVSRYVACAMLHGTLSARVHDVHCFDWVADFGMPGSSVDTSNVDATIHPVTQWRAAAPVSLTPTSSLPR